MGKRRGKSKSRRKPGSKPPGPQGQPPVIEATPQSTFRSLQILKPMDARLGDAAPKRDSRTVEALRAAQADITSIEQEAARHKEFKAAAEEAPVMLRMLSFGPALAQLQAKKGERGKLGEMLAVRLGYPNAEAALHALPDMSRTLYRQHALKSADYLLAMKRLAQAYLAAPDEADVQKELADGR